MKPIEMLKSKLIPSVRAAITTYVIAGALLIGGMAAINHSTLPSDQASPVVASEMSEAESFLERDLSRTIDSLAESKAARLTSSGEALEALDKEIVRLEQHAEKLLKLSAILQMQDGEDFAPNKSIEQTPEYQRARKDFEAEVADRSVHSSLEAIENLKNIRNLSISQEAFSSINDQVRHAEAQFDSLLDETQKTSPELVLEIRSAMAEMSTFSFTYATGQLKALQGQQIMQGLMQMPNYDAEQSAQVIASLERQIGANEQEAVRDIEKFSNAVYDIEASTELDVSKYREQADLMNALDHPLVPVSALASTSSSARKMR